jgi:hypothetical protein
LKSPESWKWEKLRHRLVLTAEEKRVISFVIAAFILGLGTKCYRERHSVPLPKGKQQQHLQNIPKNARKP